MSDKKLKSGSVAFKQAAKLKYKMNKTPQRKIPRLNHFFTVTNSRIISEYIKSIY